MTMALSLAPMILALSAAVAAERPAWRPEAADLLFTSNRDGNSEIYLLRAGAGEWINLTRHEAGDNWPAWSPDGTRIAFQSRRTGNLDIWTMKADGSEPVRLTDDPEPDYLPSWSSDGAAILFTSWRREPDDAERAPHVYLMNADGSGQRRLVRRSLETSAGATESPDGERIVYSRKAGEDGADLFIAGRDGGDERRLTSGGGSYHGSPVFSPDGTRIAFYSDDGTASALVVIDRDGSGQRTVLATGKNWYPRWSPDGRWLVYTAVAAGRDGDDLDVFAVPASGEGEPIALAAGPGRESEGSWRPRE
jgi:TolB protein